MNAVITQMLYYFVAVMITILGISFIQRGLFWKFLAVKMSGGRKILVEVRSQPSNYYKTGHVEEGFLVYTSHTGEKRISIPRDKIVFIKAATVTWIRVDDEKNCILSLNMDGIDGFDAVKYNDLYKRALYKPGILDADPRNIILIFLLVIAAVSVWMAFTLFQQGKLILAIKASVDNLQSINRTMVIATQGGI